MVIKKLLLQISFLVILYAFIRLLGKQRKQRQSVNERHEKKGDELDEINKTGKDLIKPAIQGSDDLTRISGIGPKVSATLAEAGIETFEQLAKSDENKLNAILEAAQIPFADPVSWINQAEELL
ncbi:MAG: helix-hairpin-helix domain-containing protein [Anaerolineales bacterium]|jgi:large subunit ribosomal protein L17